VLDPSAFEISPRPYVVSRGRPVGDHNRLRSVSMAGTASVRHAVEQTPPRAPFINRESPLNRSKVLTPAPGFSVRPAAHR
jgi:hypothetical protein